MVLDADNSPTVLADSVEVTAMTNQELQRHVAEAVGWTSLRSFQDEGVTPGWIGMPPDEFLITAATGYVYEGTVYQFVPDWPNDLLACMRDLWPWLIEQVKPWGGEVVLEITLAPPQSYGAGAIGYCCAAYTYPDDPLGEGISEKGGVAICHAVLAVRKKLDA